MFPRDRNDLMQAIERIKERNWGGKIAYVQGETDICFWLEPSHKVMEISQTETARVYFACRNYGPFTATVSYQFSTREAEVLELDGMTAGNVDMKHGFTDREPPQLEYRYCDVRAKAANAADDLICQGDFLLTKRAPLRRPRRSRNRYGELRFAVETERT